MHSERCVVVVRVPRVHRAYQRDVIDAGGHVGKERTDFGAALTMLGKLPLWTLEKNFLVSRPILDLRMVCLDLLAVIARQGWLGVEGIDMGYSSGHKQEDHPLGLSRKMGRFGWGVGPAF